MEQDRAYEDALAVIAGMQDEPPFMQGYSWPGGCGRSRRSYIAAGAYTPTRSLSLLP